jgi:hypothetical protein
MGSGDGPFDPVKASFYLIAGVIGVHCVVVLAGVAFCWIHPEQEHLERCSGLRGQLIETLAAAMAAALAFAGGFRRDKEK